MRESTVPVRKEETVAATREEKRTITPPVDIFENEDGLVVIADLPGVEKKRLGRPRRGRRLDYKGVRKERDARGTRGPRV
jgi:hypothetical protein